MDSRQERKALIIGLAGYNFGDEAIAVSAAKILSQKYEIIVTTTRPNALNRYGIKEVNLNRKSPYSWWSMIKAIHRCDIVYFGGGSLIQDKLGISITRGVLSFFFQYLLIARLLGKDCITLPIGVDKLETQLGKSMAKYVLKMLKAVNVRDEKSRQLAIKYLGNTEKPVNLYADPAFLLEEISLTRHARSTAENYILISLVYENLDEAMLYKVYNSIISDTTLTKYRKLFIVMDPRETDELYLYREILNISENDIVIPTDAIDALDIIRSSAFMIGMRLHCLILGLGKTPMVCLSRTTKTHAFSEEAQIPFIDLDKQNFDTIYFSEKIKESFSEKEALLLKQRKTQVTLKHKAKTFFDEQ